MESPDRVERLALARAKAKRNKDTQSEALSRRILASQDRRDVAYKGYVDTLDYGKTPADSPKKKAPTARYKSAESSLYNLRAEKGLSSNPYWMSAPWKKGEVKK
jgi:hypothetical protein